ncbi:DMT family transporter [Pseudomonas sp. SLFW]|uniref:DMT family transporter n=1 Tax=Pseudomonas sp. SLFW TaxID=2683259 RepID=UPI001412B32B|nr:DMT family transporter [Pseudomonas sp. SLFW]NBB08428.1 EamA family transporter [Pseudomonas sp. SLFW]
MSLKDSMLALLVAFLWGAQVTAVKVAGAELPSILTVAMRYAIMSLFLLPFLWRCRRDQIIPMTVIATVMGTLHFGLLYCGIARVDASTSAVIYQLATPFTLILAFLVLGEALKLNVVVGIALAFCGVLVLLPSDAPKATLTGMMLIALAALAFAVGSVLTKRMGPLDPLALSAWTAIVAGPQLLIWSLVQEEWQWSTLADASAVAWWAMIYTALSGGLLGFGLWFWLLRRNSMQQLAPYLLLVPVFAIAVSQVLLVERLGQRLLLGAALSLLGVALCQLHMPGRKVFVATGTKEQKAIDERP